MWKNTYTIVVEKDVAATTKHLYHTGQFLGFSLSPSLHVTSKLGLRSMARLFKKTQTSDFCDSDIAIVINLDYLESSGWIGQYKRGILRG